MSKFGFNRVSAAIQSGMKDTIRELAECAKDEFVSNFQQQAFDGQQWADLKYRHEPPPKLMLTGQLHENTKNSIKTVTDKQAVLENESIDAKGRSYAAYHNTGTDRMAARPFMLHTSKLTQKHLEILYRNTNKIWRLA
jgi:phage gpG-like protein